TSRCRKPAVDPRPSTTPGWRARVSRPTTPPISEIGTAPAAPATALSPTSAIRTAPPGRSQPKVSRRTPADPTAPTSWTTSLPAAAAQFGPHANDGDDPRGEPLHARRPEHGALGRPRPDARSSGDGTAGGPASDRDPREDVALRRRRPAGGRPGAHQGAGISELQGQGRHFLRERRCALRPGPK